MNVFTLILFVVVIAVLLVRYVSPGVLAAALRSMLLFLPGLLFFAGVALILLGKVLPGMMLISVGGMFWKNMTARLAQKGRKGTVGSGGAPSISSVRSAALEMELNHDTGAMNGVVLVGQFEGRVLDEMSEADLKVLYSEVEDDAESIALLDTYFDRRFPGWRENAEPDAGAGQAGATRSGPMSKEEAYEVLGLGAGATAAEIRKAHRRLMKAAHPDSGGSTFLASKINEAKDVLLRSHS